MSSGVTLNGVPSYCGWWHFPQLSSLLQIVYIHSINFLFCLVEKKRKETKSSWNISSTSTLRLSWKSYASFCLTYKGTHTEWNQRAKFCEWTREHNNSLKPIAVLVPTFLSVRKYSSSYVNFFVSLLNNVNQTVLNILKPKMTDCKSYKTWQSSPVSFFTSLFFVLIAQFTCFTYRLVLHQTSSLVLETDPIKCVLLFCKFKISNP